MSEPAPLVVVPATLADGPQVLDVIAGAFQSDPTWVWAFPDAEMRRRYFALCVEGALQYPWVLRTAGFEVVAVWNPPDTPEFTAEGEAALTELVAELRPERAAAVTELLRRFGAAHPRQAPHFYLSLLATADAHRGRGLGMGVLREILRRIDREGRPAYLESSNPRNDHRYAALGFQPIVSFQAPDEGPVVTGMWRPGTSDAG